MNILESVKRDDCLNDDIPKVSVVSLGRSKHRNSSIRQELDKRRLEIEQKEANPVEKSVRLGRSSFDTPPSIILYISIRVVEKKDELPIERDCRDGRSIQIDNLQLLRDILTVGIMKSEQVPVVILDRLGKSNYKNENGIYLSM